MNHFALGNITGKSANANTKTPITMSTKTPREIEEKLEEIKYNFLNYNGVHTKEYMYDFLVTKPMLALLEEARQEAISEKTTILTEASFEKGRKFGAEEMKEEILKKIPELKVREIKLPQDDLRVLRARQYHNQKLLELSYFIQSL